jgi:predicted patatin/cPLA2 family phospholipase
LYSSFSCILETVNEYNNLVNQVKNLEEEKQCMTQTILEKEIKIEKLTKNIKYIEEEYKKSFPSTKKSTWFSTITSLLLISCNLINIINSLESEKNLKVFQMI